MVYSDTGQFRLEDNEDGTHSLRDTGSANVLLTLTELGVVSIPTNDLTDGTNVIYDQSNSWIPQARLENDTVTITGGSGITGTSIALGSSGTVSLDTGDAQTWTAAQTFNSGITMASDINMQDSNTIINLPSPVNPEEAANKQYVDSNIQGATDIKESVKASPTVNIDLTSTGDPNPVDGYTLSDGERVLLKEQTDATENGIYVANTATDPSTWTRSPDADEDSEVTSGMFTFVENGTQNGNTSWIVTTPDPITLGSTSITFAQFSAAGEITAGDGLKKSGQTLNIEPADFAGTFLSDDGSDNLTVDIGTGLENDGSGNIRVDEDFDFTFTSEIDFNAGLSTGGDITFPSNGNLIDDIGQSRFEINSSDTIINDDSGKKAFRANNNVSNVVYAYSGQSFKISDQQALFDAFEYTTSSVAGDGRFTFDGNVTINGSDITISTTPLWFGTPTNGYYIQATGDGNPNLEFVDGGTSSNIALRLQDGGNVDVLSGKLTLSGVDTGVSLDGTSAPGSIQWNGDNAGVGIDVTGGSVSVSGTDGGNYSIRTTTDAIRVEADDVPLQFGLNQDFDIYYESATDELVVADINGVELIRQPKAGSTNFLQGIDAGSIEAPEDSLTQLVNASVTSGLTAGTAVGYTFALDNITFMSIDAEADGSGGIQNKIVDMPNTDVRVGNNLTIGGDNTATTTIFSGASNTAFRFRGSSLDAASDTIAQFENQSGTAQFTFGNDGFADFVGGLTLGASLNMQSNTLDNIQDISYANNNNTFSHLFNDGGGTDANIEFRSVNSANTVLSIYKDRVEFPTTDLESGDSTSALELDERTSVADTGKVAISRDNEVHGYAMIQDTTNGESCMAYLAGASGAVELLHDSGGANNFTTTEDNDGTTNVYYDATNSRYELNNETGSSVTYAVQIMKQ